MPTPASSKLLTSLRFVHRWLGLTVGLVFALVCVSGTALLFQPQFFRWAHGEMIPENMSPEIGSIESWVRHARSAVPENLHGPFIIWTPRAEHNVSDAGMVVFSGAEPGGLGNLGYVAVLVAPSTGEALGVVNFDYSPAYAPVFLHGALWSGHTGELVVGVMALGSLALLPLGLYLWWPPRGRLLQKLSPRPWRNTLTYASRLHDWTGIWALLILLLLAFTGLYMAQPSWIEPVLSLLPGEDTHGEHMAAATPGPAPRTSPAACSGAISLDVAIERARALVPNTALATVFAGGEANMRELYFRPIGSQASVGRTVVVADLDCGTVVVQETPTSRMPHDTAELWLSSLHDGTAFGMTGRIIVSLAGIVPIVLAWSGIRIWMRRRGWLKPRRRAVAATGP